MPEALRALCAARPQQRLYFLPLPHGHGSFRPTARSPLGLAIPWATAW